jgi:hypothetical protein
MHRVVGAPVAGRNRNHRSEKACDANVQLLKSACCLIDPTSPDVVSSTSVYAALSSGGETKRLAEEARQLAIDHHLRAIIEFRDGRLRVKFLSAYGDLARVSGG